MIFGLGLIQWSCAFFLVCSCFFFFFHSVISKSNKNCDNIKYNTRFGLALQFTGYRLQITELL